MDSDLDQNPMEERHPSLAVGDDAKFGNDLVAGNKYTTHNYYLQSSGQTLEIQGKSVRKGLQALAELIADSEVRDLVVAFRTEFQVSCEHIEILSAYKDWHDELHKLEFQCFRVIWSPIERLLKDIEDELALEELEDQILSLQQITDNIEKIATQSCLIERVNEQIQSQIKELKGIESDLNAGIDNSEPRRLRKARLSLYRILGTPRSRVNDRLIEAARSLRLSALVQAISSIRDSIQNQLCDRQIDLDKLSEFEEGNFHLEELEKSLSWQIKNHDRWQEIDIELHRIEGDIEGDPEDLELSWLDIKKIIEREYSSLEKSQVEFFCKTAKTLEQALHDQNSAKIRRYFQKIRWKASQHFDEIDVNLKRCCVELRHIGEPLNSVFKMLQ